MRKLKHQEIQRLSTDEFSRARKHPISILVDNVRSAHNLGSILRTCDAARIEHVYLAGITPDVEHRMVHKTALGAQESVPTSRVGDPVELASMLKEKGYTIGSLELTDAPSHIEDLTADHFPLLLVLGNELTGVSDEVIALSDLAFEIPQFGTKHSLNVAVAAGIAIFGLVNLYRSKNASARE